ncbi:MAG: ANTAR domain-containing protein [Actinobacteria bacterium]|nr:ANTAR domain-containing protein [Actinomycetota bacterium]
MKALDRSDELLRRADELRARSGRMCAAADEKMEKSRRLIGAAAEAHDVVIRANASDPASRAGRATADLPAGQHEERDAQAARLRQPYRPPGTPASVTKMAPGSADSTGPAARRLGAVPLETQSLVQRSQQARARAQATRDEILRGRSQREILHDSAFARLLAKVGTMPVIEQAKGILMAQHRCGPDEAFGLLRQASQRTNVKVHELAARIVGQVASSNGDGTVTPITQGARRHARPGTRRRPPAG